MQKGIFLQDLDTKSKTVNNAIIQLGDIDDSGKGRKFVSKFIQPGLVKIEGHGIVLLRKETLDASLPTIVGSPVIIQHKDVTEENADELRCGVIANAYFNQPDGWYYVDGIIWDDKAQELINKGWSVSCSYDYLAFNDEGGEENNIHYDKEFTQLNFTHLAIVDNPRYERANIVFNSKINNEEEQKGKWITVKGNHIFIPDGKTLDDVMVEKGWKSEKYANARKINEKKFDESKEREEYFRKEAKKYHELGDERQKWLNVKLAEDEQNRQDEIVKRMMINDSDEWDEIIDKYFEQGKEKQSDSEDKHGFKKDKDSGYYMKDLSDGTSVYVEKKAGGQGEKEPFYLEATHFDKDGKTIAKKQYHYDSMDGMFGKIDKDFVSKDKQSDKKETEYFYGDDYSGFSEKQVLEIIKDEHGTGLDWDNLRDELFKSYGITLKTGTFTKLRKKALETDNKTNNSKEQDMAIIEELKKLIFKVENNKENKMDSKSKILSILNEKEVDKETIEEIKNELEKIEEKEEDKKVDNEDEKEEDKKVDNEGDKEEDKKEDKVDNESDEDKEKAEDLKEDEKKDVENKCKNSVENAKGEEFFDKINKIYNSAKKIEEPSVEYESKQARLDAGKEYFG